MCAGRSYNRGKKRGDVGVLAKENLIFEGGLVFEILLKLMRVERGLIAQMGKIWDKFGTNLSERWIMDAGEMLKFVFLNMVEYDRYFYFVCLFVSSIGQLEEKMVD